MTLLPYLAQVQSLLDEGKFQEASALLKTPHPRIRAHILEVTRAAVELRLGRGTQSIYHRKLALEAASIESTYGTYAAMLTISAKLGDQASANKIAVTIAALPISKLPPARDLTHLESFLAKAEDVHSFYQRYHASRPKDRFAQFRYAVLQTVLKGEHSRARRLLIPLHREAPDPSLAAALALTHLKDEPTKAMPYYDPATSARLVPVDRAIFATAAFLNNDSALASSLMKDLDQGALPNYLKSYLKTLWPEFAQ